MSELLERDKTTDTNAVYVMPDHFCDILAQTVSFKHSLSFVARELKGDTKGLVAFESNLHRQARILNSNNSVIDAWDICDLAKKDSFFMQPSVSKNFIIQDKNNYLTSTVDNRVFGLIVSLKTFNLLAEEFKQSLPDTALIFKNLYDTLLEDIRGLANYMLVDDDNIVTDQEKSDIKAMYRIIDRFTCF